MSKFSECWDTKVRPLIIEYLNKDYLDALNKYNQKVEAGGKLTKEEKAYLASFNLTDGLGMYYISAMAFKVEHDLADNREELAYIHAYGVHNVLNRPSYWENVFKNDFTSQEAQQLKAIKEGLDELVTAM